jgi:DNA-binding CsgD family transcriptional regulator
MRPNPTKGIDEPGATPWPAVAATVASAGSEAYLGALVDLVGGLARHDRVTVTRYIVNGRPEFLAHRNFSDALAQRYLDVYYPFDPFHAYWSRTATTGVVPLSRFSSRELKQGRYIAEFLARSIIRDEVGVLLDDGPKATLAIFLERASKAFTPRDIAMLDAAFPAVSAIHALHRRLVSPGPRASAASRSAPALARNSSASLNGLWPALTSREREVVSLILAGHASRDIAKRLGISPGTVRNHRLSIYDKLDITTEREVFLAYLDLIGTGTGEAST